MAGKKVTFTDEDMDIGLIDESNLGSFRSLMMQDAVEAMESGEPVISLGLVVSGVAAGAVAGFAYDDVFEMTSLYVAPAYRKRGGGQKLLDELFDILAGEVSQIRVDFSVTLSEHEDMEKFLMKNGFTDITRENNSMFKVSLSALSQNEMLKKVPESPKVITMSEADDYLLRKEHKRAMAAGDPVPFGGFSSSTVRKDLSAVYADGDEISGYVVIEESGEGTLCVSSALNRGNTKVFPLMLKKVLDNLLLNCDEDASLMVPVISSVSAGIVKKLDPGAAQVYRLLEKTL